VTMAHSSIHPCFEALSDAHSASIPTAETLEIDFSLKRSLRVTSVQQPPPSDASRPQRRVPLQELSN
jgi:hypothetical protein